MTLDDIIVELMEGRHITGGVRSLVPRVPTRSKDPSMSMRTTHGEGEHKGKTLTFLPAIPEIPEVKPEKHPINGRMSAGKPGRPAVESEAINTYIKHKLLTKGFKPHRDGFVKHNDDGTISSVHVVSNEKGVAVLEKPVTRTKYPNKETK